MPVVKVCLECKKEFKCKPYQVAKRKYCSNTCEYKNRGGRIPWNKGKHGEYKISKRSGEFHSCLNCGKKIWVQTNQLIIGKGKYCSPVCYRSHQKVQPVTVYSSLHSKIRRVKPLVNKCEACGVEKKLDLANISGRYLFDIKDYKWLCRRCHIRFDRRKI